MKEIYVKGIKEGSDYPDLGGIHPSISTSEE